MPKTNTRRHASHCNFVIVNFMWPEFPRHKGTNIKRLIGMSLKVFGIPRTDSIYQRTVRLWCHQRLALSGQNGMSSSSLTAGAASIASSAPILTLRYVAA